MTLRVAEEIDQHFGSARRLAQEAGISTSTLTRSRLQHAFTADAVRKLEAAFARARRDAAPHPLHEVLLIIRRARTLLDDAEDRAKAALDHVREQQ